MTEVQEFKTVSQFVEYLQNQEGDTVDKQFVIDTLGAISTRKPSGQRRGQLAGLSLEDMTDEQLKREIINAKSVHYKAVQRGASEETIEKNQARVDAALAEKARREQVNGANTEAAADTEEVSVYNEEVAAEL